MTELHLQTITELYEFMRKPAPTHPLFAISQVRDTDGDTRNCSTNPIAITSHFYTISLKKIVSGELFYGRSKYDCQNGSILLTAPGQRIVFDKLVVSSNATHISFDKEFLTGHQLATDISKYQFFSYSVNEALHISEKEERLVNAVLNTMHTEYTNSYDSLSKGILLSHLQTLLQYIERFYRRQFLYRQEMSGNMYDRFKNVLVKRYSAGQLEEIGLPSVSSLAGQLGISPGYLSDSLKIETGKSALEHIHLHLIDVAKELLLAPDKTVADIAYNLGFEYPQYFSRLFKKMLGMTPSEYRNNHTLQ
ncbi:MAG TPA: AraC family transcriptional regulator [Desulfovibrio sp.]|nr:AraC family transcriptional regulator [Desulfovibrio sp.]